MNEQSLLDKEYPTQLDRIESMLIELLGKKKRKPKPFAESQRHVFIGNEFARWWIVYPKKKGKQDACKAFHAAVNGRSNIAIGDFTDMLIADVQKRLRQDEAWMNGQVQYLPNPATYIRGKRWEDDITKSASQLPKDNDELYKFAIGQGMREPHVGESWDSYRRYVQGRIES